MAHKIAVLSQKGGTGKTTAVRHLADVFRRAGLDVLAVDLDPQGNLSDYFDVPADADPTIADVLAGHVRAADATHGGIIPANLGLVRGDLDLVARGLHDRLHQQRRAHLYPRSMELVANARELGAVGASISGAGPAVMFWCHWQQTGTLIENLRAAAPDCKIQRAQLSPGGADVRAL